MPELQQYLLVKNGLYLREDHKALVAISPEETKLGILMICPESKKKFKGRGIVIEQDRKIVTHNVRGRRDVFTLKTNPYTKVFSDLESTALMLQTEQVNRFLDHNPKPNSEMDKYLQSFAEIPCEDHAAETFHNQWKSGLATCGVRYNPWNTRFKEGKEQIEKLIPPFVELIYYQIGRMSTDEMALGRPVREIRNLPRAGIEAIVREGLNRSKVRVKIKEGSYHLDLQMMTYRFAQGRMVGKVDYSSESNHPFSSDYLYLDWKWR
ncbi:MAG: hypothetical protein WCV90_01530 [Candidatus Woesearchaeota archaeon]|jgi:hypothetical protein